MAEATALSFSEATSSDDEVISIAHQTPATAMRLSTVMKQLGGDRYKNGQVSINAVRQKGYFRSGAIRQEEVRQLLIRQEAARQEEFQAEMREAMARLPPKKLA
jgi:hypothetical protein